MKRPRKQAGQFEGVDRESSPVVLLHGLLRRPGSMETPARRLRSRGFETHNLAYASRKKPIAELARDVGDELERRFGQDERRVHFLTHSLGAIVLRQLIALQQQGEAADSWKLGRVVMLAPPNQGSVLAEAIGDWRLFRILFGVAGQELRAVSGSFVSDLPAPSQVGVVAGTRSVGTYKRMLRGRAESAWENDGTVAVEETRLNEAPVVKVSAMHALIMNNREALEYADSFYRHGRFS